MLSVLNIELEWDKDKAFSYQKASLFQGVLMEQIDSAYGEELHQNGLKPYSQRIMYSEGRIIWQVKTLNRKAYEQIINPLMSEDFNLVLLKHNDIKLKILDKSFSVSSYKKLIDTYYLGECKRIIKIQFTSPTSFKQAGRYVFFPDIHLIYNSLMNKFNAFAENKTVGDEETLEQLTEYSEMIGYSLSSTMFHLEGIKIPAFKGSITLKIRGPQPLVNLVQLLLRFGCYSGVGIKTAMGMGAMEIVEKEENNDR